MQNRRGLEKIRLTKTAALLQFEYSNLDDIMFVEAKDPITGQWVLNQPEYRLIFDQLKDLPSKSRLEQRTLVWACERLDIVSVAAEIAKAVQAANALDSESVKAWHLVGRTQLDDEPTTRIPYALGTSQWRADPDIGAGQPVRILSSTQSSDSFPEDLGLWGAEFLKDG